MKTPSLLLASALACLPASLPAAGVDIRVDCSKEAVPLSPHLYGLFFEDINFAADGGLYAELVQNRSFEYYSVNGNDQRGRAYHPLYAWQKVARGGASGEITVSTATPLNAQNPHHLQVRITEPGSGFGVANSGFDGIRLDAGARYDFAFHARASDWSGDDSLTLALELPDGTLCGVATVRGVGGEWKKFEGVVTADRNTDAGRLVLTATGRGTLSLDMVSLFPQDTWQGRKYGLRRDLVEALRDLNPKFLRFPGGCIAHGHGIDNVYSWKDTVGDIAERKPNWNLWGYHQTYGLGYFEYFQLCKDLGMHPLPVVPVGVTCGFRKPFDVVPMDKLQKWIDDALDLIEFANGSADSKWGSVRAKMGHPEPFGMEFICLGNEEHDNREMRERFPHFVKAIRERYPDIKIIGTSGLGPGIPIYNLMTEQEVYSSDEHYYEPPGWFIANQNRFDSFDRSKPKIFVGEYGSQGNTLFNAIAEAAYLTGIERNGDIVDMACYAPLFANVEHIQWTPDLIFFNKRKVVRTPNYYVQQLFGQNKGDAYLANTLTVPPSEVPPTIAGTVGIGSWGTTIEVEDMRVNGRKIDPAGLRAERGNFRLENGLYRQTDGGAQPALSMGSETFSGDTVTYTVRARKTGGAEGFLLRFGSTDGRDGYWWNVGGWGNTRHAIERFAGDLNSKSTVTETAGSVQPGVWYNFKVELSPGRIRCYLDDKLVHDHALKPPSISVSSTWDKAAREVIVKLVNPTNTAFTAHIDLHGVRQVAPAGRLLVLAGEPGATNSVDKLDAVKTRASTIAVAPKFSHELPPMSVQFIRVKPLR